MPYLATIHVGFGSMAEGSQPVAVLGPYPTKNDADAAGNEFYNSIPADQTSLLHETWHNIIQIPDAPVDEVAAMNEFLNLYAD